MTYALRLLATALCLALSACGGGGSSSVGTPDEPPAAICQPGTVSATGEAIASRSTKLFKLTGQDSAIVISKKPRASGYVMMSLVRNAVTSANSAGGRGEFWRVGRVQDLSWVWVSSGGQRWDLAGAPVGAKVDAFDFEDRKHDYVRAHGAADYTFVDADTRLHVGSFHGGEVSLALAWVRDGEVFTPRLGEAVLARAFEVRQRTCVVDKLLVQSVRRFATDGGDAFSAVLTGRMNVSTAYTAMNTTSDAFTQVVYPRHVDMASLPEKAEVPLGRTPRVVQVNPGTGQRVSMTLTLFDDDEANPKGVFARKVIGAYSKIYYGIAVERPFALRELEWSQVRTFD